MFDYISPDQVLFLDIETVSQREQLEPADSELLMHWEQKAGRFQSARDTEWTPELANTLYEQRAAIYAEFGRIVVISIGALYLREGEWCLRTKSFARENEADLLQDFSRFLNEYAAKNPGNLYLCGHNIKEFDVPYMCRRLMINGLPFPGLLDLSGKKPWETPLLDTMEMWKFGDYKSYTSLALLAYVLNIPTPKDDISGADVGRVYWKEHDLSRIAQYCEKDVATVAQILLKFQGKALIPSERISSVTQDQKIES